MRDASERPLTVSVGALTARGNCAPNAFGGQRHLQIVYAERRNRVENSADDRGGRSDRSGLAGAFGSQRVMRARLTLIQLRFDKRKIRRPRQCIVHEGAGQKLPLHVVDASFREGLPQSLRDSTVELTF